MTPLTRAKKALEDFHSLPDYAIVPADAFRLASVLEDLVSELEKDLTSRAE